LQLPIDMAAESSFSQTDVQRRRSLLQRYGREPLPRYTSYPPANHWQDCVDVAAVLGSTVHRPLSLYVHVPFCRTLCFYCGCNMLVTRNRGLVEQYLRALETEVALMAQSLEETPEVVQVHVGGGTPTHLNPDQLTRLVNAIRRRFPWRPGIEASIEVHPPVTTSEQMRTLAALGFNRVSMGVQDFDPVVQGRVNRIQPFEQTRDLIQVCRDLGFVSVNVDLMYGLPLQTVEGLSRTLDQVEALRPDRIALFGYAHVPSLKKRQAQFTAEELPGPELRLTLFETALARLLRAGYVHIGLDHFALPDDELCQARSEGTLRRNFMGYTTCADSDVLAFGPSAISDVGGTYFQNERDVHSWIRHLDEGNLAVTRGHRLTVEDRARRDLIMQLFCRLEVDLNLLAERYPEAFADGFQPERLVLERLERDGLVQRDEARLRVRPDGQLLLRTVASAFDTYLQHSNCERHHAPAL
jgi:oxygen-independent coproporphyrinogen III oxidase